MGGSSPTTGEEWRKRGARARAPPWAAHGRAKYKLSWSVGMYG